MNKFHLFFFLGLFSFFACGDDGRTAMPEPPPVNLASISIEGSSIIEGAGTSMLKFEIKASETLAAGSDVDYTITGLTAEPGKDFTNSSGTINIPAGSNSAVIEVAVLDDDIKEVEEKISVTLTSATNAMTNDATAIGVIKDNDTPSNFNHRKTQGLCGRRIFSHRTYGKPKSGMG